VADARAGEVTDPRQPRTPTYLIVGLALALALMVVGGVAFVVPQKGAGDRDSGQYSDPDQYSRIVARVTEFATQYNVYDAADPADYQERLSGLLTEEYEADRAERIPVVFDVLEPKKQTSSDPKVKSVAIQSADETSAKVLVAVDATVSNTDYDEPVLYPMRWIVSMQVEDGQWRVDAFEPVDAAAATPQDSTGGDR